MFEFMLTENDSTGYCLKYKNRWVARYVHVDGDATKSYHRAGVVESTASTPVIHSRAGIFAINLELLKYCEIPRQEQ
jgi:hypothetical protein